MKKTTIVLLLLALIAGLFISCSQEMTVDADVHNKINDIDTFCINGKYFSTLQAAVDYFKDSKAMKAPGDNDNVIYLTRNASGPGADIVDIQGLVIDFAGFTYSFTNVTAIQGETGGKFGLSITDGSEVTLKGLEQIDLFDSTADLTMVYIEGSDTSLTIEDAPKMKVEPTQYVFWAANGATLTVGSNSTTAPTTISGKIAATGGTTAESKPAIIINDNTTIQASELKADAAVVVINTSEASKVDSFVASNDTKVIVSGSGNVTVTENNSEDTATYEVENISTNTESKVIIPTTNGEERTITPGNMVEDDNEPEEDTTPTLALIGKNFYTSLNDAINEVDDEETIKLLNNIEFGNFEGCALTISNKKDFVLDLNGFTVSGTATNAALSYLIYIEKGTSLTIIDSKGNNEGKITYKSNHPDPAWGYGTYTIYNFGTLTLNSGTIENTTVNGASYAVEVHNNWADYNVYFYMNGGVLHCPDGDQAVRLYANDGQARAGKAVMVMTDGEIKTNGIWCDVPGVGHGIELTISGGTINGMLDFKSLSDYTNVNITGGTFNCNKLRIRNDKKGGSGTEYPNTKPFINISGGDWTIATIEDQNVVPGENTLSITGGTFNIDPTTYVAPGYGVDYDAEANTYTVKELWTNGLEPYITAENLSIKTAEDFAKFALSVNNGLKYTGKTVTLDSDINLSGKLWVPIGNAVNYFEGLFDGNSKTITGLTVSANGNLGLFGVSQDSELKNFTIDNANISGSGDNSALVSGVAFRTTISGVNVINSTLNMVGGERIGGITGGNYTIIINCSVKNCSITGSEQVGAIAGYICSEPITGCVATDNTIVAEVSRAGGLVGKLDFGDNVEPATVSNNTISGTVTAPDVAGGICGQIMCGTTQVNDYSIAGNSMDIECTAGKISPIGILRSGQPTVFTGTMATKITGNKWTARTYNMNTYTYTAEETGTTAQVIVNAL